MRHYMSCDNVHYGNGEYRMFNIEYKKVGVIDADLLDNGTKHPNLALMKISGWYKSIGAEVDLVDKYEISNFNKYDKIYVSKVFNFTEIPEEVLNLNNVQIGGTGFFEDGGIKLPRHIEHHKPDYELYTNYINKQIQSGKRITRYSDYLNYSIGFLTRGCFRKCSFCVNKFSDGIKEHSKLEEFVDENRKGIYLWDDNFFSYPNWEELLDELDMTGKRFQFRQGLDIRLIDDYMANRITKSRYDGDYIFAFDDLRERNIIETKLKVWKKYANKTTKLYLLCAYRSIDENDIAELFERIKILMEYGCLPYVMRYESYKESKYRDMYIQIARWCNQPQFIKKTSFRQFCEAHQKYHKNENTLSRPYYTLLEFEKKHKGIADKYFDMRYEELNKY